MKKLSLALLVVALSGCTTAGPFVTNITPNGNGGLIVEKNNLHFNAFTGVVTMAGPPTSQVIQIDEKRAR